MLNAKETVDYYNAHARLYHSIRVNEGKLFNEFIEMPTVLELINECTNVESILDVGCGSGIYAKKLNTMGYKVDGVDASEEMIKISREYCEGTGVNFYLSRFEDFSIGNKYDIVLGSFILGYFENLNFLFRKMKEFLKDNGKIIVSGIHPIRASSKERLREGYFINDYFSEAVYKTILINGIEPLAVAKHSFQDISDGALKSGLNIQRIIEPKPRIVQENYKGSRDISFYLKNPSVVIFQFQKNN